jgi:hypothetical protein
MIMARPAALGGADQVDCQIRARAFPDSNQRFELANAVADLARIRAAVT